MYPFYSLCLPEDKFIYDEISQKEYSLLGRMNLKPPDITRKLISGYKKSNSHITCHGDRESNLITEEEALGLYV